jgi:hypothetical protein
MLRAMSIARLAAAPPADRHVRSSSKVGAGAETDASKLGEGAGTAGTAMSRSARSLCLLGIAADQFRDRFRDPRDVRVGHGRVQRQ